MNGDIAKRALGRWAETGGSSGWRACVWSQVRLLAVLYGGVVALLLLAWVLSARLELPISHLLRDPARTVGFHPLVGALSELGVLGWGGTAAVCAFGAWALGRSAGRTRALLAAVALLSAALTLDDAFLIHEELAPAWLGVSESLLLGLYGLATAGILFAFAPLLLGFRPLLLALALGWFALSALGDRLVPSLPSTLEDGFKLLGIVTWGAHFALLARSALRGRWPSAPPG